MLLADVVAASLAVAATRSRKEKVAALADLLARADPPSREVVTSYLAGALRQRRTGVGWRGLQALEVSPAAEPSLAVLAVDDALERLSHLEGPGSQRARAEALAALFGAATPAEQQWLRGALTGEVRQGASDALVQEAVARAADLPLPAVRRAAMLAGSTVAVVDAAFDGGEEALAGFGLEVGQPISPMLAASAPTVAEAMARFRVTVDVAVAVAVDTKLDGIRIQVHRSDDEVLVVTRSLDDITARLPEVVEVVRGLPVHSIVLDGEALTVGADGRPRPFQETASRSAQHTPGAGAVLTPFFFDLLHLDGVDLLDVAAAERAAALARVVPEQHRVARLVTTEVAEAESFFADVVAAGHEGVVLKDLGAPYEAGRRGASWVKVKPVHTLDLVVLAVEWGSGRRRGWLSNIHLGARDPQRPGEFTMLGKTFKGMTDAMLAWQTERFLELETHREGHVVHVRPEQVVEIAFDGLQTSTRYPGGVALRFARVLRYRDDKRADEADTLDVVKSLARS